MFVLKKIHKKRLDKKQIKYRIYGVVKVPAEFQRKKVKYLYYQNDKKKDIIKYTTFNK